MKGRSTVSLWAADEASDRAAITNTITALNQFPARAGLFTDDEERSAMTLDLIRVWVARRKSSPDHPAVTISHRPWGEAQINFFTSLESQLPFGSSPRSERWHWSDQGPLLIWI